MGNLQLSRFAPIILLLLSSSTLGGEAKPVEVNCSLSRPERGPAVYYDVAELGAIPAGERTRVNINVSNDSEVTFPISRIRTTCACISSLVEKQTTLKPGESLVLPFEIQAPGKSATPQQSTVITIGGTARDTASFRIVVKYELAALLCFENRVHYANFPHEAKGKAIVKIPYIRTAPIQSGHLTVKCTGDLASLNCSIDGSLVEILAPNVKAIAGLSGLVVITGTKLGVSADITLSCNVKQPFDLAPSRLRFEWDEATASYSAEFICSAANLANERNGFRKAQLDAKVWLAEPTGGWRLKTNTRHLNDKVARVSVQMQPTDDAVLNSSIEGRLGVKLIFAEQEDTTELTYKLFPSPN